MYFGISQVAETTPERVHAHGIVGEVEREHTDLQDLCFLAFGNERRGEEDDTSTSEERAAVHYRLSESMANGQTASGKRVGFMATQMGGEEGLDHGGEGTAVRHPPEAVSFIGALRDEQWPHDSIDATERRSLPPAATAESTWRRLRVSAS